MVNDLLDLTRIEQGRVRLDLQSFEPSELIAGVVQRFNERTQDAGITIETEIAPGLPPVRVDPSRIAHVFDNLVGNAIEHTDRGGVIRLKAVGDKGTIHFSVEDNGEGIAAEHLPHVFDRFYRVPGTRFTQGAGLGLAIAREIAVAHGGQLDVESMPGRGTTFTLTLSCDPTASTAIGNGRTTS
jgi:signal transduction histidine kinase